MASQDAAEAVVELVQTQLEAQTQGVNCGTSHFFNQHCLSLLLSSVFWKLVFSSIPCPKFLLKFSILLVFKATIFSDQHFPTKHPPRQCLWRKQFNTDIHRKTSSRPKRGRLPTPSAWPEVLMQAHRFVAAEAWPWARGRGTWPDHDILGNPQKDRKIKSQSRISGRYFFYFLGGLLYILYLLSVSSSIFGGFSMFFSHVSVEPLGRSPLCPQEIIMARKEAPKVPVLGVI